MKVVPQYIVHVECFLKLHNFGDIIKLYSATSIDHFTVASLVTWPWIVSEAGVDLVLIETSVTTFHM